MKQFIKYLLLSLLCSQNIKTENADMIIFSYDRPMQLYALLESIEKYVTGLDDIHIIYRTSSERFKKSYDTCFKSFAKLNIKLIPQDHTNASHVFKPLVMDSLKNSKNKYVLFGVDDIIVKDYINLSECINYLKTNDAYGFYLRLGKNITECYTEGIQTPVPAHKHIDKDVYVVEFKNGKGDWAYPCSVDMTLYDKNKIIDSINNINFYSPNRFEGNWYTSEWFYNSTKDKKGLFYEDSKIINIPLNTVNHDVLSRNMGVSNKALLENFESGSRINIEPFFKINNKAPHIEANINYSPLFTLDELRNLVKEKNIVKINELKKKCPDLENIFNIKDENGHTLLMWAANSENLDAVRFLIENNADVNAGDKNNFTALMFACWRGNLPIIELLIKHKANKDAIDVNGTTALSMADRSDSPDKETIISLLIED